MPLLSIIFPIYNVEMFLSESISSILSQDFKDFELIAVDDGSTDKSLDILKYHQSLDSRIRIISQDNKGSSTARNMGLKHAKGKYIGFVDSDDIITNEMFKILIHIAETYDLDVAGCSYQTIPDNKIIKYSFKTNCTLDFISMLSSSKKIQSSNDLCFVWRYIIRNDILKRNHILFDKRIKIGEDMIFMTEVLANSNRIMLIDEPLYLYRTNNANSLMKKARFNPELEKSLSLMHDIKIKQLKLYSIDLYTPYSKDLAETTMKIYLTMLLDNIKYTQSSNKLQNIKNILTLPMIKYGTRVIGFNNIYSTWREYFFYLAVKFQFSKIVKKIYFK